MKQQLKSKESTNYLMELPSELHRELKIEAAKQGKTLRDLIVELLTDRVAN